MAVTTDVGLDATDWRKLAGADTIVVDADVHCPVPTADALQAYLPRYWREQIAAAGFGQTAFSAATVNTYSATVPTSRRPQPHPANPDQSDLDRLRADCLDATGADYAVVTCPYAVDAIPNPDGAAAMAAALNDWLIDEWLVNEPRLHGSMLVPSQLPDSAVAEIERVGAHPAITQVTLPARSTVPYGRRDYHRVFAAAVERDLAVSIHYGGFPGTPPGGAGWPSYFIEDHAGMAAVMQSQLINLIAEGVFDRFPTLRVSLAEAGFTWLPSLMWRFDKDWKSLRREVPWVRRPPSEYIREHVKLTTQPADAPLQPSNALADILEQMWGDEILMFATDYPHWHADKPFAELLTELPERQRAQIFGGNACAHYGFAPTR